MHSDAKDRQQPWLIEVETQLPSHRVVAQSQDQTVIVDQQSEDETRDFSIRIDDPTLHRITVLAEDHQPATVDRPQIQSTPGPETSHVHLNAVSMFTALDAAIAARLKIERHIFRLFRRRATEALKAHRLKVCIVTVIILGVFLVYHYSAEVFGRIPRIVSRDITLDNRSVAFGKDTIILPFARLRIDNATKVKLPEGAVILVLGEFVVSGSSGALTVFDPSGDTETKWQGIHAIGKDARLEISNSVIADADGTDPKKWPREFAERVSAIYNIEVKIRRGGGCSATRSYLRLNNVHFKRCNAIKGGAVFLNDTPRLHEKNSTSRASRSSRNLITHCVFDQNTTSGYETSSGGGIFLFHAAASIQDCRFLSNRCESSVGCGAGVYFGASSIGEVDRCEFMNNYAKGDGGAIYIRGTYSPKGFRDEAGREDFVFVRHSNFSRNHAGQRGGAISASKLTIPKIVDCTFEFNAAEIGGAVDYSPRREGEDFFREVVRSFAIVRCSFTENTATRRGGAIVTTRQYGTLASPRDSTFARRTYVRNGRIHVADPRKKPEPLDRDEKTSIVVNNEGLAFNDITSTRQELAVGFQHQQDARSCQSSALAMLVNFRKGELQWTDKKVRSALEQIGSAIKHVTWDTFLNDTLPAYTWKHVYVDSRLKAARLIQAMIDNGFPVVMNVGFTPHGHVILVVGYQITPKTLKLACHDPNGAFDFSTGTFLAKRDSGADVMYPLEECRVTLEYRVRKDGVHEYRKVTRTGMPSKWHTTKNPKAQGIYDDWEFVVAVEVMPRLKGEASWHD